MIFSGAQTLYQILKQRPAALEILEREFGSLVWEKPGSTLANLCAATGVESYSLLEALIALPPTQAGQDWEHLPIYHLIDYLVSDHVRFRETEMPAIADMLDEGRLPAYPDGYAIKLLLQEFRHFQAEFTRHMEEEEDFLFPKMIRNEACFRYPDRIGPEAYRGSVNLYLKLETHKPEEEIKRMIVSIREKLRVLDVERAAADLAERARKAIDRFAESLMVHAGLETEVLFPRAGRLEQELYENSLPGLSRYPGDQS